MDIAHEQLLERIRLLPTDNLSLLAQVVTILESGDLSPFSSVASCNSASSTEEQKLAAWVAAQLRNVNEPLPSRDWPHAPLHRLSEYGTYIVTSGTLNKEHCFRGPDRLSYLESTLLRLSHDFGWQLEAWAVFSNHYHFIAHALEDPRNLRAMLKQLHGETACHVNKLDGVLNRNVWYNFWDTELTYTTSYLARLNYVHQNAVKHGLVPVANQIPWCSAAWFERTATPAQVKTIYSFRTDKVKVHDDFEPV